MSKHPTLDVCMSIEGETHRVGRLGFADSKGQSIARFEYDPRWLELPGAFEIDPEAPMTRGQHFPAGEFFKGIGDSAPDKWGREIMRRREVRRAKAAGEKQRTLFEYDYLIGVADLPRMGGIRLRYEGEETFQTPLGGEGVPALVALPRLYEAAGRIERGQETDEDLTLLFCQGSSLGGARPKASIRNNNGELSIAKFPKDTDTYSLERWESIALTLAGMAGMDVSEHSLIELAGRDVLLSVRFDRESDVRIPFMSAMARLQAVDGEQGSYLDMIDDIVQNSNRAKQDRLELFRRVVFNVLISNVDDHLRNHGFLYRNGGWSLSPLYDVNPTPVQFKPRILTTAIDFENASCSIDTVLDTADFYQLSKRDAETIVRSVAKVTSQWRAAAERAGAKSSEIRMMESAFEHEDLDKALA